MKRVLMKSFLAFGFCFYALTSFAKGQVLFSMDGKKHTYSDLPINVRQEIFELENKMQRQTKNILDHYLMERYVKLGKTKKVSEKEAKAWFDKNKEKVGGRSFAGIKKDLVHYLTEKKSYENKMAALGKKLKKLKYKSLVKPQFKAPVFSIKTDNFPAKGKKNSSVTIVEFADYQCPHCKHTSNLLHEIADELKDKVKFVYIDFPVNPSGVSKKVAHGAYCAHQQNKFWAYNKEAFHHQDELSNTYPESLAKELKLDLKRFKNCLTDSKTLKHVEVSKNLATNLGISGTPAIFINGVKQMDYSKSALLKNIKKNL